MSCGTWWLLFLTLLPAVYCNTCEKPENTSLKKPNIVYILADDLGWNDVGFHNSKVKTPNIDWLAKEGIELTQFYMQPICSPSRSSLMTGKYPSNNGLQHIVILAESKSCLPLEHKILTEYMKENGYATKYVGKWHLGYCHKRCLPESRGIDAFRGILGGECDYYSHSHNNVLLKHANGRPSTEKIGAHLTRQDGDDVREMILSHRNSTYPLFMIVSPTAPHVPLQATNEMYNVHDFLDDTQAESKERRRFLGLVSALDELVGKTINALREANMDNNTIIIFSSDNGGANIEPPFPGFPSHANNYPLRNGKYSFHEGGTRVPAIYYDPRLPLSSRGSKRNFLMHVSDWLPTFLDLTSYPRTIQDIDGVSQATNLGACYTEENRYRVREEMLVALTTYSFTNDRCSNQDSAYRWKDWKLLHGKRVGITDPDTIPTEYPKPAESADLPTIVGDSCWRLDDANKKVARCLFNIKDDPSETTNLYDERPDLVEFIQGKITQAKKKIVRNAFHDSLGTNNLTAIELGEHLVPQSNYCNPDVDFPLTPIESSCHQ